MAHFHISLIEYPVAQKTHLRVAPTPQESPSSRYSRIKRTLRPHLAHTPILRLPSKKIQQSRQWLSHQAKADPEDAIPQDLPIHTPHLLQRHRHIDHRDLRKHAHECNPQYVVRRYSH